MTQPPQGQTGTKVSNLAAKLTTISVVGGRATLSVEDARTVARTLDKISDLECRRQEALRKIAAARFRDEKAEALTTSLCRVTLSAWLIVAIFEALDFAIS